MTAKSGLDESGSELFELKKRLGSGGFAHTYVARVLDEELIHEYGSEFVALKIPLGLQNQKVLIHEVERNIYLQMRLLRLNSANICRYLGFAPYDGQIVMVMEYLPQGSLRDILGSLWHQKRMPMERAIRVAQGVLGGLSVIHGERLLHRDIKPENILMDGDKPKIADLGIARMIRTNEFASTSVGTIYYMSPEMLSKEGGAFQSDIWSLGVMLYEMITGRLPFGEPGMSAGELIDIIRYKEHARVNRMCPDIPEWLSDIVDAALAKTPDTRIESAEKMSQLLACEGQPRDECAEQLAQLRAASASADPREMEKRIKRFIERYPRGAEGYQLLGEHLGRSQLHGEAIEAFRKGLTIDPSNGELHWLMALALHGMGDQRGAITHLEAVLSSECGSSLRQHAGRLLKMARTKAGMHDSAALAQSSAPDSFEHDFAAVCALPGRDEEEGRVEEALKALIEKYPRNAQAYQCLGEYYNRQGLDTEAIEAFKRGIAIEPDSALLHWDIALAYQRKRQKQKAIAHLQKAVDLGLGAGLRRHAETLLKALSHRPKPS